MFLTKHFLGFFLTFRLSLIFRTLKRSVQKTKFIFVSNVYCLVIIWCCFGQNYMSFERKCFALSKFLQGFLFMLWFIEFSNVKTEKMNISKFFRCAFERKYFLLSENSFCFWPFIIFICHLYESSIKKTVLQFGHFEISYVI